MTEPKIPGYTWESRCRRCGEITVWWTGIEEYPAYRKTILNCYQDGTIAWCEVCKRETYFEFISLQPDPNDEELTDD